MKNRFFYLLIAMSSIAFSQKGKSILILKDSTKINGFGEISGLSSVVAVKFKNDSLKWKKYNSKKIIGIDILENNYYRKFRYKYVGKNRFPEILEIVSIDSLSLYVKTFSGSMLTNSFLPDNNNESFTTKLKNPIFNTQNQFTNEPQYIELEDGTKIPLTEGPKNQFTTINFPRSSYYVGYKNSDRVEHLYSKGLPFAKGFKKSMLNYFKNCPSLIIKVENKEFNNDELWRVLSYYNKNCLNQKSE